MGSFLLDLRLGLRMMLKAPLFTAVAILTLALGVGANTAVFSFVSATLLRALPLPEPERIVVLGEYNPGKITPHTTVSPRNLEDWQRQSRTLEHFGQWRDWHGFRLDTPNGTETVSGAIASPELFQALGVKPGLGRTFLPEENRSGRDQVVVLSHSFWQSHLGGDPGAVGKSITLNKKSWEIVGVLPAELEALDVGAWKIWAPVSIDEDQTKGRHLRNRQVYARLRPGVTLEAARAEMSAVARGLAEQYPQENSGWLVSVTRLQDHEVQGVRPMLLIFMGATALVLLIACANVANLLLARSAARRKEFAIRVSLGAGRAQIVRQLLAESLLLALLGGAAGLLLASWLVELFVAISPAVLPGNSQVKLDGRVLGFTFALSALTGIIFGLAPALASMRLNLVEELKDGVKGSRPGRRVRTREVLVVAQVALAVTLLVGAGLLGRTFLSLTRMRPGYNPEKLLTVALSLPDEKYQEKGQVIAFYRQAREALETIPGVESVGSVSAGPQFGGHEPVEWAAEGQAPSPSGGHQQARFYDVGPGYFRTMQIPLLQGREFTDEDDASAPQVAIINETMARAYWPQGDALGKRLLLPRSKQVLEVVGVAGDARRFNLESKVEPEIYWPYLQKPRWATYFVLRTGQDPAGFVGAVRARLSQVDPEVVISRASTMDALIQRSLKRPRFNLVVLGVFACTALLLATVGVYGVVSYSVSRRTREVGIRLALGAEPRNILRMIIGETLTMALFGVGLGLLAALAATRVLTAMLFGVKATDPPTYVLITALVVCAAALAGYIPASRAARVDPMNALRYE